MDSYRKVLAEINFLYYYYLHVVTITVVVCSSINEVVLEDLETRHCSVGKCTIIG